MQNAECSKRAFCNAFDLHQAIIGLENQFLVFILSGRLIHVLLYVCIMYVCIADPDRDKDSDWSALEDRDVFVQFGSSSDKQEDVYRYQMSRDM